MPRVGWTKPDLCPVTLIEYEAFMTHAIIHFTQKSWNPKNRSMCSKATPHIRKPF